MRHITPMIYSEKCITGGFCEHCRVRFKSLDSTPITPLAFLIQSIDATITEYTKLPLAYQGIMFQDAFALFCFAVQVTEPNPFLLFLSLSHKIAKADLETAIILSQPPTVLSLQICPICMSHIFIEIKRQDACLHQHYHKCMSIHCKTMLTEGTYGTIMIYAAFHCQKMLFYAQEIL